MSYPASYNMKIQQGSTFSKVFTWKVDNVAVDLSGYTARMQVRSSANSSTVLLSATSSNYITLGGAAGTITFNIPATVTAALNAGSFVYDLELVTGSTVTALLAGDFQVVAEVTRD